MEGYHDRTVTAALHQMFPGIQEQAAGILVTGLVVAAGDRTALLHGPANGFREVVVGQGLRLWWLLVLTCREDTD